MCGLSTRLPRLGNALREQVKSLQTFFVQHRLSMIYQHNPQPSSSCEVLCGCCAGVVRGIPLQCLPSLASRQAGDNTIFPLMSGCVGSDSPIGHEVSVHAWTGHCFHRLVASCSFLDVRVPKRPRPCKLSSRTSGTWSAMLRDMREHRFCATSQCRHDAIQFSYALFQGGQKKCSSHRTSENKKNYCVRRYGLKLAFTLNRGIANSNTHSSANEETADSRMVLKKNDVDTKRH